MYSQIYILLLFVFISCCIELGSVACSHHWWVCFGFCNIICSLFCLKQNAMVLQIWYCYISHSRWRYICYCILIISEISPQVCINCMLGVVGYHKNYVCLHSCLLQLCIWHALYCLFCATWLCCNWFCEVNFRVCYCQVWTSF